jgi:multiple sugar transport system substrate-binding protein
VTTLRGVTWDHVRGWGGLRAAADEYRRTHPDVEIVWEARSLQAFADQPIEELEGFDLIVLDHPSIGTAVARGSLLPLDDHLPPAVLEDQASSSVGRSAESYVWEGRRWALTIDAAAQVALASEDLLAGVGAEVPRTWEEVLALARTLRGAGLSIAMPAIPVDAICAFLGIAAAVAGEPMGTEERFLDRDAARTALEILEEVLALAAPESLGWNPPTVHALMSGDDRIAYCPLAFGYVTFAVTRPDGRALAFAPGPAVNGTPSGTLGGAGLAISARSAAPAAAADHAAFVASASVQRGVYLRGGGQPGHRSVWTSSDSDAAVNGFFSRTLPALDAAYLRPRHEGFLTFQDAAGALLHRWLTDGGDRERLLDAIDEAARSSRRTGADR